MRGAVEAGTVLSAERSRRVGRTPVSLQRQTFSRRSGDANREGKRLSLPCHRIAERLLTRFIKTGNASPRAGLPCSAKDKSRIPPLSRRPNIRARRTRSAAKEADSRVSPCWTADSPPAKRTGEQRPDQPCSVNTKQRRGVPAAPGPIRHLRVCFCGKSASCRFFSPAITVCGVCGY